MDHDGSPRCDSDRSWEDYDLIGEDEDLIGDCRGHVVRRGDVVHDGVSAGYITRDGIQSRGCAVGDGYGSVYIGSVDSQTGQVACGYSWLMLLQWLVLSLQVPY